MQDMMRSLLLVALATIAVHVRASPQAPCAASWNGFFATSDSIPLSFAPFACQQFLPVGMFPANIPSSSIAAGIIANMASCASFDNFAYIWGYQGLGPSQPGQCMVLDFQNQIIEVRSGAFCQVFRPFICYVSNTYTSLSNLYISTSIKSETTPSWTVYEYATDISTSLTDTTDDITTILELTTTIDTIYTTTIPTLTVTQDTAIISQFATTVLTSTSTLVSTNVLDSTVVTQEFVYFVTTTTQVAVPGSTTVTTILATTTVCPRVTTVSRCPSACPTNTIKACPCKVKEREDFVVVSNMVPFNQANCACERIFAELASPSRREIRKATDVMRDCLNCDGSQGAWIEPVDDNLCSVLTPTGDIKFVPCDSKQHVLCRVPQSLAKNNCFECQFHDRHHCASRCPVAPKTNPWHSQCYCPDCSSHHSNPPTNPCGCGKPPKGIKNKANNVTPKQVENRVSKTKKSASSITFTVCPTMLNNIFVLYGVEMDPGFNDYDAACFQAGGSLLQLQTSQFNDALALLNACGQGQGYIASYNTGPMEPCGVLTDNGIIVTFTDPNTCGLRQGVLCYVGNNPPQTTASSIVPFTFTSRTTLFISTILSTLSLTVETTSTVSNISYTATTDTEFILSTELFQGIVGLTETTTVVSTDTQSTGTTLRSFATAIDVSFASTTISSAIATATSTNYLGTSVTSATLSIVGNCQ